MTGVSVTSPCSVLARRPGVSRDQKPIRLSGSELMVGVPRAVQIAEVHRAVGGPEQCGRERAVEGPVASGETVGGYAEEELGVCEALSVTVPEIHETRGFAVKSGSLETVTIEVAYEGLVSGVPEDVVELGRTQAPIAGPKLVDDVEPLLRRAIDRHRIEAVSVEGDSCECAH